MKMVIIEEYDKDKHADEVKELVANIRLTDIREAAGMGYDDISEGVNVSLEQSACAYVAKGSACEVIGIFGVSAIEHKNYGRAVWFLGTNALDEYQREFIRHSKTIIEQFLKEYGQLYNYVSVGNKTSIRWLKSLGADFSEPFEINGEKFVLFLID